MIPEKQIPDSVDLEHSSEELIASDSFSGLGCPDCGGSLWQLNVGSVKRYQCHVGHAFLAESLIKNQGEAIERHLWSAMRLFREQAILARQLAAQAREQHRSAQEIEQIDAQFRQALRQAETLRQVLLSREISPVLETRANPPRLDE